jgi:hypothetical protein
MLVQNPKGMVLIGSNHAAVTNHISEHNGGCFYLRFCHWDNLMYFIAFAEYK